MTPEWEPNIGDSEWLPWEFRRTSAAGLFVSRIVAVF
jgi:hypothetical protein